MTDQQPKEGLFAGRILSIMASRLTAELATFSNWMIVGFAAIWGLVVANLDKVASFIPPQSLGLAIKLFLVAVIFNVVQRYLAVIVSAGAAVSKEVEGI